ncbi:MAG: DUF1150 family protein [Rhodobacteraceae bacterium]|nr:DUF1150 family protein [Paracoccaceae bacterium]
MENAYPVKQSNRPIVYVRPIKASDLPEEIRAQLPDVVQLYAIHHEEGEQMAVVTDRTLAFVMARQNDYTPVSVH